MFFTGGCLFSRTLPHADDRFRPAAQSPQARAGEEPAGGRFHYVRRRPRPWPAGSMPTGASASRRPNARRLSSRPSTSARPTASGGIAAGSSTHEQHPQARIPTHRIVAEPGAEVEDDHARARSRAQPADRGMECEAAEVGRRKMMAAGTLGGGGKKAVQSLDSFSDGVRWRPPAFLLKGMRLTSDGGRVYTKDYLLALRASQMAQDGQEASGGSLRARKASPGGPQRRRCGLRRSNPQSLRFCSRACGRPRRAGADLRQERRSRGRNRAPGRQARGRQERRRLRRPGDDDEPAQADGAAQCPGRETAASSPRRAG